MASKVFWLTGLSGAGKTTVCQAALPLLAGKGIKVKILDGDEVRATHQRPIGFLREDVLLNNLHICGLIERLDDEFDVILVPTIAPYEDVRQQVVGRLGEKISFVYCDTSVRTATERDTKGLYAKEKAGEIRNLIGVSDGYAYEVPRAPALTLHTDKSGEASIRECSERLVEFILARLR
jgi:adenylylsulfate kinase-like enzyme